MRDLDVIAAVNRLAIGVAAAMGDPGAIARAQNRLQGSHEPAGRDDSVNAFTLACIHVRLAIGYDKQPAALQLALHVDGKPLCRPG